MKLMIASDLHGSAYYTQALLRRLSEEAPEKLVLLGDILYHGPRNALPRDYDTKACAAMLNALEKAPLCVRGNCDGEVDQMVLDFPLLADFAAVFADGYTLYLTHGHHLDEASKAAAPGDIVLYGHTHVPAFERKNEKYYVNPAKTKLDFPSQKRNLIYIFMESMESSYADQEDGGIMDDNYIPNLTKLAKENINFSDKADGKLGGSTCLEATAYTVGGMVAQTAAINLKLHNSGSMFGNFLPNLTTMGDILNKEGYQQVFLCGSEGDFAGRDTYFTSHKDFHIEDYNAAKKEGFIAPDYKVFWGHEDEILYKRAKKQLEQLSSSDKPFNLTMLTVDTHFPRGYKCRLCKDKYNRQYANVIACADQQVYDFVEWIKKQDFYKNTTIVIAGDHTTMVDTSDPIWSNLNNNYKRTVYNTIINADCTYKENVTENRDFSTMDMFPTTLAALGVQIDGNRLGLGTNLFSGQKTLPEKLGRGYINQELKKNDKEYNGFY